MKVRQLLAAAAFACAATGASAVTLVESSLDTGTEGWVALNGAHNFQWVAAGGFIEASDFKGQELWFFAAPAAYRGNISAAYGGALSYALMSSSSTMPIVVPYADVQILGTNGVLLAYAGSIQPSTGWTDYSVPIVANGAWHVGSINGAAASAADMLAVLSSVEALRIRGDYKQAIETTALDAVVLTAGPVPEPGAGALALAGLAVMGVLIRRRRR